MDFLPEFALSLLHWLSVEEQQDQGLVKGAKLCFRYPFTFIFDMEKVLLQPANSLLQPAKKVRSKDLNKVLLLLQDLEQDSIQLMLEQIMAGGQNWIVFVIKYLYNQCAVLA